MNMVGAFQLVFDQYPLVVPDIAAKNVRAEGPYRPLTRFEFKIKAQRLS